MGKSTRKKQLELEERENIVAARLAAHRESGKHARGVITAESEDVMNEIIHTLEPYYIRPIEDWVYKGKSKDLNKQRLSLVRHLCGIYPVPSFLELPMTKDKTQRTREPVVTAISTDPGDSIVQWYVAVAQGQSLYKTCTRGILTKKETHLLLQAPNDLKIAEAIWWARSMAIKDDIGIAYRIARCRTFIIRASVKDAFWIDVHRFFVNNPVPIKEMEELLDYIIAERRQNTNWTIKKRSLEAIRRKSEEWHRAMYKLKHIGGGSWRGIEDIPDWKYTTGKANTNPHKSTEINWRVDQIVTGNRLAQEGQKMRHCVASYKSACVEGRTAIFSMTSDTALTTGRRNLTIEVNQASRSVVQARGYANRNPNPDESNVLSKWARENDIAYRGRWY